MVGVVDMENMSLPALYLLLAERLQEIQILGIKENDQEFRVRRLEIETIQNIIERKKIKEVK